MFIMGTGSLLPEIPPRKRYRGISREIAAALALAMDTARISQSGLILGSVCIDHCLINGINIGCIHSLQSLIDYSIDIFYSLLNTLAQISALIAVSQFQCLELTGRCSTGSHAASDGTVYQSYLCFYGRIASGIQNLSSNDFFNL
jgi:hypothetical protein